MGVTSKTHKKGCAYLPIGNQTATPNELKFGVGAGIDRRMVCRWVRQAQTPCGGCSKKHTEMPFSGRRRLNSGLSHKIKIDG